MDKLKYVKLEQRDGTYSDSIPLFVDSNHVDVNGNTLTEELNNKVEKSVIDNLQSQINSVENGSPLNASSIAEMTDTSRIYVNTTDGKWYYYANNIWNIGGVYQSRGISDYSISKFNFNNELRNDIYDILGTQNLYNTSQEDYALVPSYDTSTQLYGTFALAQSLLGFILPVTSGNTITIEKSKGKRFRIATSSILPAQGVSYIREWHNDNSTKQVITLNENENYIFVDYYSTTVDTLSQNEIKNSIKVYYGEWINSKTQTDKLNETLANGGITNSYLSKEIIKLLSYRPLGHLNKGYLCLIADDGNMTLSTNTFDILKNYEVPATFALMSNSAIMNEQTGDIDGLKDMINNHGCSVCQHGLTPYDEYTEDELLEFFDNEKEFWNSKNITVKGLCYPNHINNQLIRAICGSRYDICCGGWGSGYITSEYQLNTDRSNIFALSRTSVVSYTHLNDAIDYAIENNKLMIVFWHDNSIANKPEYQTILENFISYAKDSGIEFITLDKIMNL